MLEKVPSPDLRAEIVWIPILAGDDAEAAARAAARFTDPRAKHYFDPDRALGTDLGQALGIPPAGRGRGVAWDVYLVYPKGTAWNNEPAPRPAFWMHQLSQVPASLAPRLDAPALRARVQEAL